MYLKAIINQDANGKNGINLVGNTPGKGSNTGREVNGKNGKFNFIENPYKT